MELVSIVNRHWLFLSINITDQIDEKTYQLPVQKCSIARDIFYFNNHVPS